MSNQNFENHRRIVPLFLGTALVLLLTLIGAMVNLWKSLGDHGRLYSASLLVVVVASLILALFYARIFALKAQDRAIRAEENLRHFVLTGRLLDARLTIHQIIALRFASDAEFPELARKSAEEGTEQKDIKRAVKSWRADEYRV